MSVNDDECRFIKEISIITRSRIRSAKFSLKIYSSNENGEPDELIHDIPIISSARKGKNITTVDVSGLKIYLFSKSFFVVFDQLYLEENSYYKNLDGKREKLYEPKVSLNNSNESFTWVSSLNNNRKWRKIEFLDYQEAKYYNFQIEVTLTN